MAFFLTASKKILEFLVFWFKKEPYMILYITNLLLLLIYWSFNTQVPSVTSQSNNFWCFRIDFCLTTKCSVRSIIRQKQQHAHTSSVFKKLTRWIEIIFHLLNLLKNEASFTQEITRTSQTYRRQNQSACPTCCAFLSHRARLPWHAQKICAVTIVGTVLNRTI